MDSASVPAWLQIVIAAGSFGGVVIAAVVTGRKSAGSVSEGQATVLAGSITDSKTVQRVIDAIDALKVLLRDNADQSHRDTLATRDALESNTRALKENADAIRAAHMDPRMLIAMAQLQSGKGQGK